MGRRAALRLVDTTKLDRDQWLEVRKGGIGSSDAAAAIGLNPYKSPLALWLDKTGRGDSSGEHQGMDDPRFWGTLLEPHLTVNAGAQDALIKLRNGGVTSLAFYVRAGESGTVESVPNGTYQIMFATGDGFSRKCLEFVTSMDVISDPSPQAFEVTSDGYAEYYTTATYTLTTQVGGNFRPQTVDDNSFRE